MIYKHNTLTGSSNILPKWLDNAIYELLFDQAGQKHLYYQIYNRFYYRTLEVKLYESLGRKQNCCIKRVEDERKYRKP